MKGGNVFTKAEMLSLTYGAVVAEVIKEQNEDIVEINKKLEEFGFNIGVRLIDEFLAESKIEICNSFAKIGENIAKIGLKMFLGVDGNCEYKKSAAKTFNIKFKKNPLDNYVMIPDHLKGIQYSQVICGVIKGALNSINLRVEAKFTKDKLNGDEYYEIQVQLEEKIEIKITEEYK